MRCNINIGVLRSIWGGFFLSQINHFPLIGLPTLSKKVNPPAKGLPAEGRQSNLPPFFLVFHKKTLLLI
jgi:hypothetical protein